MALSYRGQESGDVEEFGHPGSPGQLRVSFKEVLLIFAVSDRLLLRQDAVTRDAQAALSGYRRQAHNHITVLRGSS